MDRIKHYQHRVEELKKILPNAKCPRIKAELRLELAQCQLTIAAIRYGILMGYQKDKRLKEGK